MSSTPMLSILGRPSSFNDLAATLRPAAAYVSAIQVSVSAMKSSTAPRLQVGEARRGFTWVDGVVMLALLTVFCSALHFDKGMLAHFDASGQPAIDP